VRLSRGDRGDDPADEPHRRPGDGVRPDAIEVVDGDLLEQPVEAIVNAWNRNVIPWWLLLPQGVSGAIKRRAGLAPFREVARAGPIPLGGAVVTGAGRLPYRAIIHVAGIDMLWRASERSIRGSVASALAAARERGFASLAFPVIGAGSGGMGQERALGHLIDALRHADYDGRVRVVKFRRGAR
jgi:O-acetyl-ADP-ribose deacetylase